MKEYKRDVIIYICFTVMICVMFISMSLSCKSQVFITPSAQVSIYDQSIGLMAGYKYKNLSTAFNYQIGNKYKEQSLFLKYQFNESEIFNVGFSGKIGYVNNFLHLFYPAVEIQYGMFQLGVRPVNNGLLILEPRLQIKFK